MKENTHLGYTIEGIEAVKAKYDKNVKEVLADVQVLSRIIKYTVSEVWDMSIEEIMKCIDYKSIEIGTVPVNPGLTNYRRIENIQTENSILNEGYITFDIRFAIHCHGKSLKIIINIEAQRSTDFSTLGYHLENRMIYYLSRLISSQKETEFFHSDYDDIKKVYSIWICMDTEDYQDSISRIALKEDSLYGEPCSFTELDKMCGIVIRIRKNDNVTESKNMLIAMLEDMFANESYEIKKQRLESKYNLKMTVELERRIDDMCNLSSAIEQKGIEKGIEKGIISLVETLKELGKTNEFIVNKIMEKFSLTEIQANKYIF